MSTIGIGPRAAASAYKKALERINGQPAEEFWKAHPK